MDGSIDPLPVYDPDLKHQPDNQIDLLAALTLLPIPYSLSPIPYLQFPRSPRSSCVNIKRLSKNSHIQEFGCFFTEMQPGWRINPIRSKEAYASSNLGANDGVWRSLWTPNQTMEPQNGSVHLHCAQRRTYH
jgi:hypothetical protein